jgi:hypothetical protein
MMSASRNLQEAFARKRISARYVLPQHFESILRMCPRRRPLKCRWL